MFGTFTEGRLKKHSCPVQVAERNQALGQVVDALQGSHCAITGTAVLPPPVMQCTTHTCTQPWVELWTDSICNTRKFLFTVHFFLLAVVTLARQPQPCLLTPSLLAAHPLWRTGGSHREPIHAEDVASGFV